MSSVHQVSAGGVVFRYFGSTLKICFISRRSKEKVIWCLPKGHREAGETLEETALREVREETGLLGSVVASLGYITYQFFDPASKKRIFKKVHFFLIRCEGGSTADHDDEVEAVRWFPLEEALAAIEFKGELEILNKADKKIRSLNEQK